MTQKKTVNYLKTGLLLSWCRSGQTLKDKQTWEKRGNKRKKSQIQKWQTLICSSPSQCDWILQFICFSAEHLKNKIHPPSKTHTIIHCTPGACSRIKVHWVCRVKPGFVLQIWRDYTDFQIQNDQNNRVEHAHVHRQSFDSLWTNWTENMIIVAKSVFLLEMLGDHSLRLYINTSKHLHVRLWSALLIFCQFPSAVLVWRISNRKKSRDVMCSLINR